MTKAIWALGLMSGTSLDGVDAALLKTDGENIEAFGASLTLPYNDDFKERLRALADVQLLEQGLTRLHAHAVAMLLEQAGMKASEVDVIGFHGQTIRHQPAEGFTWQIGDGSLLAELTGIDVVCDFRRRDVAAGGQGAPLVPVYHAALAQHQPTPVVFVNIGGIANITYVPSDRDCEKLIAFDTGPGNCLIDRWVKAKTGAGLDFGGALGMQGTVDEARLVALLAHPFITAPPPKSRHTVDFTLEDVASLSLEDGAATLAAFTAHSIVAQAPFLPEKPQSWIICGGGAHNGAIMKHLQALLPNVSAADTLGLQGDAIEAQAFAYLAVRSLRGLPLTFTGTTGVSRAVTGGAFYQAGHGARASLPYV